VRVVGVRIFRVDLPLVPFEHSSSGPVTALEEVVAAVRTDQGVVGYGEVRGNCHYVTGDTPDRLATVASTLAPLLLGQSLEDLAVVVERIDRAVVGNSGAKALLDIALHDALARSLGVSVATLLGGRRRDRLPANANMYFAPADDTARQAERAVREGYRVVKVRVGLGPERDDERLDAVRRVVDREPGGAQVTLAVDANGAFQPKEAVLHLRRWERFRLGWIEQPVPARDFDGLRFVREHGPTPVMADESAQGPREVLELVERRAVDLLHFKLCKAGGFAPLRTMMAVAEAAGVPYMMGQMDEGMLATAAAAHAGAASSARHFEVDGNKRVTAQPFAGLKMDGGALVVPEGPGLGVSVDEGGLRPVAAFGAP
jgi:L-alanine-DL-glutamate epimerase-like enolase superfamily enzyme